MPQYLVAIQHPDNSLWLVQAILRGYDPVQTVGFLGANFGLIFEWAVVVGISLYGLSILLEAE